MNGLESRLRSRHVGHLLVGAAILLGACAGRSSADHDGNATGGAGGTTGATGGTSAATGGTATGGTSAGTGGAGDTSAGGSANAGSGSGGDLNKGGTSGSGEPGKGGSGAGPNCAGVLCAPIPTSCREIVQEPGACCPTCTDTGCEKCPAVDCDEGTHAETVPGECCPSCVADLPDACEMGQAAYKQMRETLLDKYGSLGCTNSTECAIVWEDNACASSCAVMLPTVAASSYIDNLDATAQGCETCDPPLPIPCPAPGVPACVNGKCTAAFAGTQ